ncbi:serine integrase family protein [Virgibacillus alimentarius]|uniref:DNA invertase Pin-like site-specific DNA recombinase n=1 Tax=Virgibacillus alimentarius TaxID=698769 RepID=A0ABS4SCC4_9BACI|nr:recombinase family protein [Virgibacillus alimentarius]MBP2259153.1 DNA invertase Pin-like site-specific DNA recombinase [Virgibacillus alimentarius]
MQGMDRLSRNPANWETVREALTNYEVLFIDKSEAVKDFAGNDNDSFTSDVEAFASSLEYKMIKKRLRDGKLAGAMKGHWVNGKAPFGYEYSHKHKRLVPDTEGSPSPVENMDRLHLIRQIR